MSLKKIRINIFTKIFGFSILIVGITLLINSSLNHLFLENFYIHRKKQVMLEIVDEAKIASETKTKEEFQEYKENLEENLGVDLFIINDKLLKQTEPPRRNMTLYRLKYNKFAERDFIGDDAKVMYYKVKLKNDRSLVLATSLSVIEGHSHESNLFNRITAVVGMLFSLLIGLIFSRRVTKSIEHLNKKAEKISKLDFSKEEGRERNDEIGDLSKSLDKMAEELESSINSLKDFVSNASHELRTPIGVITTHSTALLENKNINDEERRKYNEIILKTSTEMKELVENLLTLSKLDASVSKIEKKEINLKEMIEETLEKYDILELNKDLEIKVKIKTPTIEGDKKSINLIINNLIQNALKYSVDGGEVKIYQEDKLLKIENIFRGRIENMEKLTQAFARGRNAEDESIEGTGLGLSIVDKAAKLSGINYKTLVQGEKFIVEVEIF